MFCLTLKNDPRYVMDQNYSIGIGSDPMRFESRAEAEDMAGMANLTLEVMGHDDRAIVIPEGMDLINRLSILSCIVILIDTDRGPRMLGRADYFGADLSIATDDGAEAVYWLQQDGIEHDPWLKACMFEARRVGNNPRLASIL